MTNILKAVGLACLVSAACVVAATATPLPQETVALPDDNLAVTVASANVAETDPLDSEMTIWVGEVDIQGRKAVWVELIDAYGEVVYESEVGSNETHLLPDGRAIVVNALDEPIKTAKADQSRVQSDGHLVFTRRVVEEGDHATSVEFVEAKPLDEEPSTLPMASVGETIWSKIMAFFEAAATRVQVAWNWLFGTAQA